jgi:hypothetical protein
LKLIDMDEPAQSFPVCYAAADVVRCDVVRCCFSVDAEKNICALREYVRGAKK